jgi:hypothetical protein
VQLGLPRDSRSDAQAAMAGVSGIDTGARLDLIISDDRLADEQTGITAIAKLREALGGDPGRSDEQRHCAGRAA